MSVIKSIKMEGTIGNYKYIIETEDNKDSIVCYKSMDESKPEDYNAYMYLNGVYIENIAKVEQKFKYTFGVGAGPGNHLSKIDENSELEQEQEDPKAEYVKNRELIQSLVGATIESIKILPHKSLNENKDMKDFVVNDKYFINKHNSYGYEDIIIVIKTSKGTIKFVLDMDKAPYAKQSYFIQIGNKSIHTAV